MIITAAITAAVAFVAKLFGVTLSAKALVGVAIVVKIILVLVGMLASARLLRWREAQKAAGDAPPKPADPGSGTSAP